jgi:hypothetical protein
MPPAMAKSKRSNRDHAHQTQTPSLNNKVIAADLEALLTPALYAQQKYYRLLGILSGGNWQWMRWIFCPTLMASASMMG